MPKEVIRNRIEVDDGSLPWAQVGWGKAASYVELGVIAPEGNAKLMVPAPGGEWIEAECAPGGVGFYVQLDRDGINRTIKALRKARDDAFGRDQ